MKKQGAAKAGSKEEEGKPARHNLNWTVHLLAACRKDELEKLEKWQGLPRCVAMYRYFPLLVFVLWVSSPMLPQQQCQVWVQQCLLLSPPSADGTSPY